MIWDLKKYADNVLAISEDGQQVTYKEMDAFADRLYEVIGKKTLVFNLCTNTIGSLAGYLSMLNKKVVPLMLTNEMDDDLFGYLFDTYKPEYLWVPKEREELIKKYETVFEEYDYALLKTGVDSAYELYEDLALLLTTSGSTGSPKLVRQSYANIIANTESIVNYLELDSTERPITTLPMNYTYGISIVNSHAYVGATILLTQATLMQKEFWAFFKAEEATSFGGVPYTYEMLKRLRLFRMDLPSLRTMTQAGGKLSPELHKEFAEYAKEQGKHFVVMYGQTEATARMAYLPHDRAIEKYGSMGIAIPGGKFSLIDVDGNEIDETEVTGELVYEGANVTLGYAECGEDLKKGDERNGRLVTGDMAKKDKDGFYYIVGRKKRFLKIYGNRVNLDQTERLVKEEFTDVDCCCAGVDDKMYIFVTKEEYTDKVKKYVADKTNINLAAFKVKVIDEVPKNEAGKTMYKELEKYYD